jgi:hypothetical protein
MIYASAAHPYLLWCGPFVPDLFPRKKSLNSLFIVYTRITHVLHKKLKSCQNSQTVFAFLLCSNPTMSDQVQIKHAHMP